MPLSQGAKLAWAAGGLALVALILFVASPALREGAEGPPPPPPAQAPAPLGQAPDISSMSPREAADRLFDRVMRAAEGGDTLQARQFLPMAVAAHDRARPLDSDGLFHLALLHRVEGDLGVDNGYASSVQAAEEALADDPTHLLNLGAAGAAALADGDLARARRYYERFLEAYDEEMARRDRTEYLDHSFILPEMRREAQELLNP